MAFPLISPLLDAVESRFELNRRVAALALGAGALVIFGGLGVVILGGAKRPASTESTESSVLAPVISSAPSLVLPPASPAVAPPMDVSSLAQPYPLTEWFVDGSKTAGWMDTVAVEPPQPAGTPMNDQQVLVLTGWAGDGEIGVRSPKILITLCDTVVGVAPVNLPRPDVAEKVHPNLANSGWRARLLIGHLVRCEGSFLEAWALSPSGEVLFPINNRIRTTLPPRDPNSSLGAYLPAPAFKPGSQPPLKPVRVVVDKKLNLRRGPGTNFPVVNSLVPGAYQGFKMDVVNDWVQIIIESRGGWINQGLIKIEG